MTVWSALLWETGWGCRIMIDIPENIRKNLPKDFAIGKIDLREAETIANEDILSFTEGDLIEGLEDLDFIPLKEPVREERRVELRPDEGRSGGVEEPEAGVKTDGGEKAVAETDFIDESGTQEHKIRHDFEDEAGGGSGWVPVHELDLHDQGKKWVPLHELDIHDQDAVIGTGPRDKIIQSAFEDDGGTGTVPEIKMEEVPREAAVSKGQAERKSEPADELRPPKAEGYVESDDEYVIWDMTGFESVPRSEVTRSSGSKKPKKTKNITVESADDAGAGNTAGVSGAVQEAKEPDHIRYDAHEEPGADRGVTAVNLPASGDSVYPGMDARKLEMIFSDDRWRADSMNLELSTGQVHFIEDLPGMAETAGKGLFDESMLDKIIGGMIQIDEGKSFMLTEARLDEDRERIAVLTEGFEPAFEELFIDLDFKYSDEELDYIHAAIIEEDYSEYIREIDEFFGGRGTRVVSASVELLGLTTDEFDTIEDTLFKEEFLHIHRYERYHLYEFVKPDGAAAAGQKLCRYLMPHEESLLELERDSIESDISAGSALIFEENVEDIRSQLLDRTGKKIVDIVTIKDVPQHSPVEEVAASIAGAEPEEPVIDITDRVVILDDKADVERFVSEFPQKKQVNIKILLKYLDGLFEKLPESVVKKFANSEYFDLYLKVLNELGV